MYHVDMMLGEVAAPGIRKIVQVDISVAGLVSKFFLRFLDELVLKQYQAKHSKCGESISFDGFRTTVTVIPMQIL